MSYRLRRKTLDKIRHCVTENANFQEMCEKKLISKDLFLFIERDCMIEKMKHSQHQNRAQIHLNLAPSSQLSSDKSLNQLMFFANVSVL